MHRLDRIDKEILTILQSEGRTTNAELARRVELSPPSVLQRVRKLEDDGTILGYHAALNPEHLGFSITVIVLIGLDLHREQAIETFRAEVGKIPEVLECLHISGNHDFLARIIARDMADYERIVRERLSGLPGVGKLQSCFVIHQTKSAHELPVL